MKATWNGKVIAESDKTIFIENSHYFPPDSVNREFLAASDHKSVCPWKGKASYYDLTVSGEKSSGAAWYYPEPKAAAAEIKDHVAFWKDVEVSE